MSTTDLTPAGFPKRPIRPLHGIPDRDPRGCAGLVLSALFHLLIVVLLVLPPIIATSVVFDETTGGGGPGPAGGGGGGRGGTGGEEIKPEKLRYLQVAPIPKVSPSAIPPVVPPPPKPPEPTKQPDPVPTPPTPTPQPAETPSSGPTTPTPGAGGGTGHDGSGGNGPGSGGGVGSGVGTGRGSGNGPGTGGGPGEISPARVTDLTILPMPVPKKVKPYDMVAVFEVDERGVGRLIAFNPTNDSGYNRKIREMLAAIRFRPAVRQDGTPVRDTVSIQASAR